MEKKLRISFPLLLLFFISGFTDINNEEGPTKLQGSWEYATPTIGLIFQTGSIEFTYKDSVFKGNVIFDDKVIPMKNLIFEDNKVRAHIDVEGERIDIFLKFQSDTFQGTVSHPRGYLRVTGSKVSS